MVSWIILANIILIIGITYIEHTRANFKIKKVKDECYFELKDQYKKINKSHKERYKLIYYTLRNDYKIQKEDQLIKDIERWFCG